MAVEVHRGRPILYGCGDLINDYEGIGGHEAFRPEIGVAHFVEIDAQAGLRRLDLVPFRRHRLRLRRAEPEDVVWLRAALNRECRPLGVVLREERGTLGLRRPDSDALVPDQCRTTGKPLGWVS
jgi:poly-gamma-glutamate capsule biosynthesis protein CapA/YwtB (metallophosphatase superfamily)